MFNAKENYRVDDLLELMKLLRSEQGCPWDREQTHRSIRSNVIEEAYEVAEAIDEGSDKMLCEELGDLLLQVIFHSQMADEENSFNFDNVADGICKKLVERHPHVFAEVSVSGSAQVLDNWAEIKKQQKNQNTAGEVMDSVAKSLPALMRAQKIAKAEIKFKLANKPDQILTNEQLAERLYEDVRLAYAAEIDAEEILNLYCNRIIDECKKQGI